MLAGREERGPLRAASAVSSRARLCVSLSLSAAGARKNTGREQAKTGGSSRGACFSCARALADRKAVARVKKTGTTAECVCLLLGSVYFSRGGECVGRARKGRGRGLLERRGGRSRRRALPRRAASLAPRTQNRPRSPPSCFAQHTPHPHTLSPHTQQLLRVAHESPSLRRTPPASPLPAPPRRAKRDSRPPSPFPPLSHRAPCPRNEAQERAARTLQPARALLPRGALARLGGGPSARIRSLVFEQRAKTLLFF